jgi:hypothetical protein
MHLFRTYNVHVIVLALRLDIRHLPVIFVQIIRHLLRVHICTQTLRLCQLSPAQSFFLLEPLLLLYFLQDFLLVREEVWDSRIFLQLRPPFGILNRISRRMTKCEGISHLFGKLPRFSLFRCGGFLNVVAQTNWHSLRLRL